MRLALYLIAIPLAAQMSEEKRQAQAAALEKLAEVRNVPIAVEYFQRLTPIIGQRVVLADWNGRSEPVPLAHGVILVPPEFLALMRDEAEFVRALRHMAAHIVLKHGTLPGSQGWIVWQTDLHGSGNLVPMALRSKVAEWEREAEALAQTQTVPEVAPAGFEAAREAVTRRRKPPSLRSK
ncbi:MAG: hypothetical protein FJW30_01500 [Acidobacteria bacterium]|nr:hypothetical protein [Acidobacteriota bacterium]